MDSTVLNLTLYVNFNPMLIVNCILNLSLFNNNNILTN